MDSAALAAAQQWFLSLPPERQVGIHRYIAGKEAAPHTEVEGQLAIPIPGQRHHRAGRT
ncbi:MULTISPECIES: hypothetical protein [unclassified Rhodococcus (in: high G+C Gram-positive bacteria)]|uniref:hypothetical protein n=1 Tax=unclassified Rhodococcus (in: high G+C Gram-positive bacteria) TaxID=192944 RepID=UPI0015958871|nr:MULTISPECIES: hypothetical protein [unclassified Rhodococcus (in: high G+C Gram-positive bacteria)]